MEKNNSEENNFKHNFEMARNEDFEKVAESDIREMSAEGEIQIMNGLENDLSSYSSMDDIYFKCEACGKSFSHAGFFTRHIGTHKGNKENHQCESCGKSYTQAKTLNEHIYTVHGGHKDFKSKACGKSFSRAQNLETHVFSIHHGRKDYQCESCGKSFSQKNNLKIHINTKH